MKTVFLTIDIEEWYHLDYLKDYDLDKNSVQTVPQIIDFLDMLDKLKIRATFFVLGEIAHKYADIIRDIRDRGHEIGSHGLDHDLLYDKTEADFKMQILESKKVLDEVLGGDYVSGYRASCFSIDRKKLDIIKDCGFRYDSSYISFAQHPLYGKLDMTNYEKIDDLIYHNKGFYEIEIPTIKIGKFNIPISGGGYLRLFPFPVINFLIKRYSKVHDNFLIYIHPFELTSIPLPLKNVSLKDKFRASVGRNKNLNKLEKLLVSLKSDGAEFKMLGQTIKKCRE